MAVINQFNFEFKLWGESFKASCTIQNPTKEIMYRVLIESGKMNNKVLIAYKNKEGEFWAYPMPQEQRDLLKAAIKKIKDLNY
ncbi:MAG: hypothetical protein V4556_00030 [Bacteroidota bacterium]